MKWKQISKNKVVEDMDEVRDMDSDLICEMANILREDHPELPSNVYISAKQGSHGPKIKVQLNDDGAVESEQMAPITISKNPEFKGNHRGKLKESDLQYFYKWIRQNINVLTAYWNGTMQIERVLKSLKY